MAKRGGRVGNDAAASGKPLFSDDEPILWRGPEAPAKPPAHRRQDGEMDTMEAELEAAMEYILALEGDAGIDRIVAAVTRTVARRGLRRPS